MQATAAATAATIDAPDPRNLRRRAQASWTLYDFANTIFSYAIVSGAMGQWLVDPGRFGEATGQLVFSIAIAVSVGLNAIVSPILGALSDRGGRRLPFLFAFTALCIAPTAVIGVSGPYLGTFLFIVANFGYQAALIYYDASLKLVSTPERRGRLSGVGTGIGYCGTVFVALLIQFGHVPVEARFPLSAVLFALFAIPVFVVLHEPPPPPGTKPVTPNDFLASWSQLRTTWQHAGDVPGLRRFLVGRFFYSDAVNTVIVVMTVVATQAVGFDTYQANLILLVLTLVAIAMSFAWGWMCDRLGPRQTLITVLVSWAVGLVIGAASLSLNGTGADGKPVPELAGVALFVIAGAILGSGLGGVQVSDRVFMVRLSPPARVGEFFGVYGLVGKASQVIGQVLYGAIIFLLLDSLGTAAYQVAILSLIVTMLIGLWLVWPVSDRWAGSGEVADAHAHEPPPLLSPDLRPFDEGA
jgi:UMF1 family MFS transporter